MACTTEELYRQFDLAESLDQANRNLMDRLDAIEQALRLIGIDTKAVTTAILCGGMTKHSLKISEDLGYSTSIDDPLPEDCGHVYLPDGFLVQVLNRLDAIEKRLNAVDN